MANPEKRQLHHHHRAPLGTRIRETIVHPINQGLDFVISHLPTNIEEVVRPTANQIAKEAGETISGAITSALAPGLDQASDAVRHIIGSSSDVREIWKRAKAAKLGSRRGRSQEFFYKKIHEGAERQVILQTPGLLEVAVSEAYNGESREQQRIRVGNIREGKLRLRGKVERSAEEQIAEDQELSNQVAERIKTQAEAVLAKKKSETESRIAGSAIAQAIDSTMTGRDIVEAAVATGVAAGGTFALSHAPLIGPLITSHPRITLVIVGVVSLAAGVTAGVDILTGRVNGGQRIQELVREYKYVYDQVERVKDDPLDARGTFTKRRRSAMPVSVPSER